MEAIGKNLTAEEWELLGVKPEHSEAQEAMGSMEENEEELSTTVQFRTPYVFEGNTYTHVDLSGLEHMTAGDVIRVANMLKKNNDLVPELSMKFACIMAARASKKPVEFFLRLPARDAMKVKNTVVGFMFGTD